MKSRSRPILITFVVTTILVVMAITYSLSYCRFLALDTLPDFVHLRGNYETGGGAWDQLYMERPQKLGQERLNLNSWGGFHELKLNKNFEENNFFVSLDTALSDNSYIFHY